MTTLAYETLVIGLDRDGNCDLASAEAALGEIAALLGRVERRYFVESCVNGRPLGELKKTLTDRFGLTDRQFTAIRMAVDGKVAAARDGQVRHRDSLKRRIAATEKKISTLEKQITASIKLDGKHREWRKRCAESVAAGKKCPQRPKSLETFRPGDAAMQRQNWRMIRHQKKRYRAILTHKLETSEATLAADRVGLCFGTRKLFAAQHHLDENGFADHAEWLAAWRAARSSSIFCVGSSDETNGNQTATLFPGNKLRLRVPPALEAKLGRYLWLSLKPCRRCQDEIEWNCLAGRKIAWRLVRKTVKRGTFWFAQATIEQEARSVLKDWKIGAWGVDLNATHVAATRMDRFGNPVETKTFPFETQDKTSDQVKAQLGNITAELVRLAVRDEGPLVCERLDFAEKKAALRERGKRYARMLSSFVYSKFADLLDRRAEAHGVLVKRVNPAFTSLIGGYKFASGYNLSIHHAAALAIARRGYGFEERLARCEPRPGQSCGTPQDEGEAPASINARLAPVRTRGRHVWSDWRRLATTLRAERRQAEKARCGKTGKQTLRPRRFGMDHRIHMTRVLRPSVTRLQTPFPAGPAVRPAITAAQAVI